MLTLVSNVRRRLRRKGSAECLVEPPYLRRTIHFQPNRRLPRVQVLGTARVANSTQGGQPSTAATSIDVAATRVARWIASGSLAVQSRAAAGSAETDTNECKPGTARLRVASNFRVALPQSTLSGPTVTPARPLRPRTIGAVRSRNLATP